ncbi:hypothetical protein B296_00056480 [Ensete ventricosum]|uniref:Uncharacterized protein n=1 Tax=Ensete ventricosum TaxID=4639 RepID=A0A426XVP4_ENSVE|nr:hypothetical protein B296_00056480 [Ensete ventricosum]
MVYTIPASAWTWLVRPSKASAVTTNGARLDAGEGNPGSVIVLQKRFGVGMATVASSMDGSLVSYLGGRLLEWWSSVREEALQLGSGTNFYKEVGSGAGAFVVSVVGHSYMISLLSLLLTMSSYLSTMPAVLAMRCAPVGEGSSTSAGQLSEGTMTWWSIAPAPGSVESLMPLHSAIASAPLQSGLFFS